jgi:hypothetical protein
MQQKSADFCASPVFYFSSLAADSTKLQSKSIIYCSPINPLKIWRRSNICEQQQQIEIAITKKLRAD